VQDARVLPVVRGAADGGGGGGAGGPGVAAGGGAKRELLAEIERNDPTLAQYIDVRPFDLQAMRQRLGEGQVVVQYVPGGDALTIHLVTRTGFDVVEYAISRDALFEHARAAALALERDAKKARGLKVAGTVEVLAIDTDDELAWLYEALVAPVETRLRDARQIAFVRAGPLNYVPFPALLRRSSRGDKRLVEYFGTSAFSTVQTLYLLELALDARGGSGQGALVVGDPDGTLPGARSEADAVAKSLASVPLLGDSARLDRVLGAATGKRYVHLATHGLLDPVQPFHSYLQLAGAQKLDIADIMEMHLDGSQLVTLSACQTGRGADGLEYATIARAFGHAGAETVIAALWSIPDDATRQLIGVLYQRALAGESSATALAEAQREMIRSGKTDPVDWAGLALFGI